MKKTTRILALALVLCMAFAMLPAAAHAEGSMVTWGSGTPSSDSSSAAANAVMKQDAYFRTGPSKSYGKVAGISEVPKGASIAVIDNSNSEYWKVVYKNTTGYVFASYVKLTGTDSTTASGGSNTLSSGTLSSGGSSLGSSSGGSMSSGTLSSGSMSSGGSDSSSSSSLVGVTTKTCNFRVGSSTSSAAVAGCKTIPSGKQVSVLDNSGTYWKVSYNGYTGWIYGPYVKLSSGSSSSGSSSSTAAASLGYASFSGSLGSSSDRWGSIQIDGTNISAYI